MWKVYQHTYSARLVKEDETESVVTSSECPYYYTVEDREARLFLEEGQSFKKREFEFQNLAIIECYTLAVRDHQVPE